MKTKELYIGAEVSCYNRNLGMEFFGKVLAITDVDLFLEESTGKTRRIVIEFFLETEKGFVNLGGGWFLNVL